MGGKSSLEQIIEIVLKVFKESNYVNHKPLIIKRL
jgi:hypothetical protein